MLGWGTQTQSAKIKLLQNARKVAIKKETRIMHPTICAQLGKLLKLQTLQRSDCSFSAKFIKSHTAAGARS